MLSQSERLPLQTMYLHESDITRVTLMSAAQVEEQVREWGDWPFRVGGSTRHRFDECNMRESSVHQVHKSHAERCEDIKEFADETAAWKSHKRNR